MPHDLDDSFSCSILSITDRPSTKKELMNKLKAERLQVKETRKVLKEKQDEDRSKRFKRGASNPIRL